MTYKKRNILVVFIAAFIVCFATLLYFSRTSEDMYTAHGYVELKASALSFERAGQIDSINVIEGQKVNKGDILAVLNSEELSHQLDITKAKCKATSAKLSLYEKGYRKEEIEQALANVKKLTENYELSELSYKRINELYRSKSVSIQEKDNALFNTKMIKAQLDEAKAKLSQMKTGFREEEITQALAENEGCLAEIQMLEYKITKQSVIKAPFSGSIRTSFREEADYVTPSQSVFEIVKTDRKRIAVFASYEQLPFIHTGNKAFIKNGSDKDIAGVVTYISDTAMFTPKTVQTQDLRADLVYKIRVETSDPDDTLKYGQPVTVVFDHAD